MSVHGSVLCWTARIAATLLSLLAVSYLLSAGAKWDSGWIAILAAIYVFVLSLAPSLIAWWTHRLGGVLVLVVCFAYTEGASRLADRANFVHVVLPLSAVWAASGILHLVVSWKER